MMTSKQCKKLETDKTNKLKTKYVHAYEKRDSRSVVFKITKRAKEPKKNYNSHNKQKVVKSDSNRNKLA